MCSKVSYQSTYIWVMGLCIHQEINIYKFAVAMPIVSLG